MLNSMKATYLVVVLLLMLTSCGDSYDRIARDPLLKEIEEKIKSDLESEDAVVTTGYDSIGSIKGDEIKIIIINSKKVSLNNSDEDNAEWCYSISHKLTNNVFESLAKFKLIEVRFVERRGFLFKASKFYAHKYEINGLLNNNLNRMVVTPKDCEKWGLPPVSFEVEYPNGFVSEQNPTGGFYLQLRKLSGDTILQEISFGRIGGDLDESKLKKNLIDIDSQIKSYFKDNGQQYNTDFIGKEIFNGDSAYQIKATLFFKALRRDQFIADGEYKSIMACAYSPSSPGRALTIAVISSTKEQIDSHLYLGSSTLNILKSFQMK
jgi:hypothetical protein